MLIIAFDGVLGAFLPPLPTQNSAEEESASLTETLILRPGITDAMIELLSYYKIAIVIGDTSVLR